MTKEKMRSIATHAIISLIELDFDNNIENMECYSIEEYCENILAASRKEIEEIIGRDMEDIRAVEYWLNK